MVTPPPPPATRSSRVPLRALPGYHTAPTMVDLVLHTTCLAYHAFYRTADAVPTYLPPSLGSVQFTYAAAFTAHCAVSHTGWLLLPRTLPLWTLARLVLRGWMRTPLSFSGWHTAYTARLNLQRTTLRGAPRLSRVRAAGRRGLRAWFVGWWLFGVDVRRQRWFFVGYSPMPVNPPHAHTLLCCCALLPHYPTHCVGRHLNVDRTVRTFVTAHTRTYPVSCSTRSDTTAICRTTDGYASRPQPHTPFPLTWLTHHRTCLCHYHHTAAHTTYHRPAKFFYTPERFATSS